MRAVIHARPTHSSNNSAWRSLKALGKPRMFKVSSTLISMLNTLHKRDNLVFGGQNPRNYTRIFTKYRNRMAFKLQNPRLIIPFKSDE